MLGRSKNQGRIPFCAGVDWGTSSFRLWIMDRSGAILAESRSGEGMIFCNGAGGFPTVLAKHLAEVSAPDDLPVIICGMAGARQGWLEAPYVNVPAPLVAIADLALRVPEAAREIRILPGMSQRSPQRPDVMRGEETQLLGMAGELDSAFICLPGTHSKWVTIEGGNVHSFSTCMTGELFFVLRQHSTLRFALADEATVAAEEPAFQEAVADAFGKPADIIRSLFTLRAETLLASPKASQLNARLSGLLIGAELATAGLERVSSGGVVLAASGSLSRLYASAFAVTGVSFTTFDAEEATRKGLLLAAQRLWS